MGAVITIPSEKGGAGKTTIALMLSLTLHGRGLSVAVVDADVKPDSSGITAYARAYLERLGLDEAGAVALDQAIENKTQHIVSQAGYTLVTWVGEKTVLDVVADLAESHDIVLVDVQGSANEVLFQAASYSNLVLIPSLPSRGDIMDALKTRAVVSRVTRMARRDIACYVVLNQTAAKKNAYSRELEVDRVTRAMLAEYQIPTLEAEVYSRTGFRQMTYSGELPKQVADIADRVTDEVLEKLTQAIESAAATAS